LPVASAVEFQGLARHEGVIHPKGSPMAATLTAYLSFDGDCAEAMRFFARVLDARVATLMTYAQAPGMAEHGTPRDLDRVMHAYLVHPDFAIMAGDASDGMP